MTSLRQDYAELTDKIVSLTEHLSTFRDTQCPHKLTLSNDKWLLAEQLPVMKHYAIILEKRLALIDLTDNLET
jgi:hypothetical protein